MTILALRSISVPKERLLCKCLIPSKSSWRKSQKNWCREYHHLVLPVICSLLTRVQKIEWWDDHHVSSSHSQVVILIQENSTWSTDTGVISDNLCAKPWCWWLEEVVTLSVLSLRYSKRSADTAGWWIWCNPLVDRCFVCHSWQHAQSYGCSHELGERMLFAVSCHQRINTASPMEAELVGVHDVMGIIHNSVDKKISSGARIQCEWQHCISRQSKHNVARKQWTNVKQQTFLPYQYTLFLCDRQHQE